MSDCHDPRADMTAIHARIMAALVRTALALAAGGLALGLTFATEYLAGIPTCTLCQTERWTYRAAIVLGAVAMVMPLPAIRALLGFAVLVTVANAGLAVVDLGTEYHIWRNPFDACAVPQLAGSLVNRVLQLWSSPPAPCDWVVYLISFEPPSMAAVNALYAAACAAFLSLILMHSAQRT